MENKLSSYERAKKRVKCIKGFYTHLSVYIVINLVLIFIKLYFLGHLRPNGWNEINLFDWAYADLIITPVVWGIGLLIHGIKVFYFQFGLVRRWEERQIRKIMESDEAFDSKK
ncbi:2TM domain-containing protein [Flagellimonas allohymeniacidonis]|uniref:2TM domain-containing protein n=1 Tax=Flagellimonas allohymeniacidonis TaxID=2517819 RepID=A0A4Q8QFC7_9FLAO|nr:2TM domain-containing protein [Allomuricauda hymeniacidonis]TAI49222.1 2TM domain-containing protein [Allomuricauda hymeniacidonis]